MTDRASPGAADDVVRVFVSYAHEDKRWLDPEDRFHLIPFLVNSLRKQNVVFWSDPELVIADEYRQLIESEIDRAQIALLIVSQYFLNSRFIETVEMPRIAGRAGRGGMLVAPVLVEPCDWQEYPLLADREMVPASNPLIEFTESEARWARVRYEILEGLKTQIKRIRESRSTTKPPGAVIPERAVREAEVPAPAPAAMLPQVELPSRADAEPVSATARFANVSGGSSPASAQRLARAQNVEAPTAAAVAEPPAPGRNGPGENIGPSEGSTRLRFGEWRLGAGTVAGGRWFRIPVRVWVLGISLATAAVSLFFELHPSFIQVRLVDGRPAPPEPAPQAANPAGAQENSPSPEKGQNQPPAADSPSATAPVEKWPPDWISALAKVGGTAPPVAAPADSQDASSLATVMSALQSELNAIGPISLTTYFRNRMDNSISQTSLDISEVIDISADSAQCRISFRRLYGNVAPKAANDARFNLATVRTIAVKPAYQFVNENVAATRDIAPPGERNLVAYATDPPVTTAVKIVNTDGATAEPLDFYNRDSALQFARDLNRAVHLCGGHASLTGVD
jgi:hypothetical protein